ncbi:MAG: hypothetical protein AM325_005370 [Candidatus Thorarchaeota archaeon SMTZ1-45]|nr:MAG: hypothetical protein AM325_07135 [Candidatus Thorarchaeota archaeon SMTZ1-45]
MIRLMGVLTIGGVPIKFKSSMEAEGELILGPLIEATKALSDIMGSGEVRRLAFKDNTLIVTETTKGFTVVALVSKAEDYMDSLLRVIAEKIDESEIQFADGSVNELQKIIVERILNPYVRDHIEVSFPDALSNTWNPVYEVLKNHDQFAEIIQEVDDLLARPESEKRWTQFRKESKGSLNDALAHALRGEFDKACAIALDNEGVVAGIFSIKMGALAHSMTKAIPPTLAELRKTAATLSDDHLFTDFVKILVGSVAGEVIPADYSRVFRESMSHFEFIDDDDHLMLGFLFLDPRVVDYPEFSESLLELYRGKSEVYCSFIEAIQDRNNIFAKLYSITSYDGFKEELGLYKAQISNILGSITWVTNEELMWELQKEEKGIEIGITASLRLQNYIAVLIALTESPVLSIGERKEFLEEVLMLYRDYFRALMTTNIPLFAYTLDSVFQSVGVAHAEYYFLSTGDARNQHIRRTIEFLGDIYETMVEEWPKARVRFSLFVVTNSISPVLARAGELPETEIRLMYAAMQLLDVNTIDATQITRPTTYATYLGNTNTSLTALASRLLKGEVREKVLKDCVDVALDVQEWFLSFGEVIRDDAMSASYHASLIADTVDVGELRKILDRVIDLNRIIVQDPTKFDYELAMMSVPLMDLLSNSWRRLADEKYLRVAKSTYDSAISAWKKYGFHEKAENFKKSFSHSLES